VVVVDKEECRQGTARKNPCAGLPRGPLTPPEGQEDRARSIIPPGGPRRGREQVSGAPPVPRWTNLHRPTEVFGGWTKASGRAHSPTGGILDQIIGATHGWEHAAKGGGAGRGRRGGGARVLPGLRPVDGDHPHLPGDGDLIHSRRSSSRTANPDLDAVFWETNRRAADARAYRLSFGGGRLAAALVKRRVRAPPRLGWLERYRF